jgi:hypothetical protein
MDNVERLSHQASSFRPATGVAKLVADAGAVALLVT